MYLAAAAGRVYLTRWYRACEADASVAPNLLNINLFSQVHRSRSLPASPFSRRGNGPGAQRRLALGNSAPRPSLLADLAVPVEHPSLRSV